MAKKKTKKRMGRPPVELTDDQWRLFESFCKAGVPEADIAEALGVVVNTINAIVKRKHGCTFYEYRKKKRGTGRAAIAAKQLELALAGDRTMLIWLGKNWLGQSDRMDHRGRDGGPICTMAIDPEKLKTMTDEELNALERAITKLSGPGKSPDSIGAGATES